MGDLRRDAVVPTHVGMNQGRSRQRTALPRGPHARGDEPDIDVGIRCVLTVVPTHVGMNRRATKGRSTGSCGPHARGDEPTCAVLLVATKPWSPRTWG
ncbi:hypothetical protein KAU37_11505 [Candidatus Bipolaricaulota bacterium]|nr:hypothetical protein [Candidatus Bipolaricaulota bacterium]